MHLARISSCEHEDEHEEDHGQQADPEQGLHDRPAAHRILGVLLRDRDLSCSLGGNRLLDGLNLLIDDGCELLRGKLIVECATRDGDHTLEGLPDTADDGMRGGAEA